MSCLLALHTVHDSAAYAVSRFACCRFVFTLPSSAVRTWDNPQVCFLLRHIA
jgi:hypothetical protein